MVNTVSQWKSLRMDGSEKEKIAYPQTNEIVLWLFCGYVIFWYLQGSYRIPVLGAMRFEFIYGAVLGVIVLVTGGLSRLSSPLVKYVVLLFLCMLIEIPFSYNQPLSWSIFVDRVLKFAAMGVFIAAFVTNPRSLIFFLGAFLLACLKMGQEGFLGMITGNMVWENQGIMRLHGATPLYEHPNSFSGMALGTLPFIYYLFPLVPRWAKIVLALLAAFSANIILFTGSRTGYVAFFVMVMFVFYKSRNKKKFFAIALVAGILGLAVVPQDYVERFESIFTGQEKEGRSSETRIQILKDAWEVFLSHPLGVGVAAFPTVRMARFGRVQDTHNLYLEIATNLGIQGLIIFAMFIYSMLKLLNKLRKSALDQIRTLEGALVRIDDGCAHADVYHKHIFDLKLMHATVSAVYLFIVIRLALGLFGMDLYEIYWWFASGLAVALYNIINHAQKKTVVLAEEIQHVP